MSIMLEDYKAQWLAEGRQEGRQEGLQEGLLAGRAEALAELLGRKFGPLSSQDQARIHLADSETVNQWMDRLWTIKTVDDLWR